MFVSHRLHHPWTNPNEIWHEHTLGLGIGISEIKIWIQPRPGVQGQEGVPGVPLQPQPCISEKIL